MYNFPVLKSISIRELFKQKKIYIPISFIIGNLSRAPLVHFIISMKFYFSCIHLLTFSLCIPIIRVFQTYTNSVE